MADITSHLPVTDAADGTDGAAAPALAIQVAGKDGSGNLQTVLTDTSGRILIDINDGGGNPIASINSELLVTDIINTASQYRAQSVTTTAAEALGGATILSNRKVLVITPTNGTIYWGTSNTVTTATGTPLFANQMLTLAFTNSVHVFVIAAATTDVRILEAS